METDLRAALIGSDRERSLQGVLVAAGVSAVVLVVSFLPLSAGAIVEPGLVVVGVGLAGWWAYDNSGLAVSVALVLGPVGARVAYYEWLYLDQPSPVGLPLSFAWSGAWKMWVPLALVFGIVAFAVGVALRRGRRFAAGRFRSVA